MERVPTQTDLIRLCDAVDDVVQHYAFRLFGRWENPDVMDQMKELSKKMQRLHFLRKLVPAVQHWKHWNDEVCDAYRMLWTAFNFVASSSADMFSTRRHFGIFIYAFEQFGGSEETWENVNLWFVASQHLRAISGFVPCEVQEEILKALAGTAMTADDLSHEINRGRQRLYKISKNNPAGGLDELTALGLVRNGKNDRNGIRGYYLPNNPPKKAH